MTAGLFAPLTPGERAELYQQLATASVELFAEYRALYGAPGHVLAAYGLPEEAWTMWLDAWIEAAELAAEAGEGLAEWVITRPPAWMGLIFAPERAGRHAAPGQRGGLA